MTAPKVLPINITPVAIQEVKSILTNKGIPTDYYLRIGIKGSGGCGSGGLNYLLGFDLKTEHDEVYLHEEVEILIDKRHLMYILDQEVDFISTAEETGFVFNKL